MNWGPIGLEVYKRTYSRIKPDGERETWLDTVNRVVDGNCDLANNYLSVMQEERDELKDLITNFRIMPAGRHLWVSGVKNRQYLFNCHRAGWTDELVDHVLFMFLELMRGGGIGANYSQAPYYMPHTSDVYFLIDKDHKDAYKFEESYTDFDGVLNSEIMWNDYKQYTVADSQAGWAKALELVVASHFSEIDVPVILDFTDVRPEGEPIKGFGGTASGPYDLMLMLRDTHDLLNVKADEFLAPLDLMEIDHSIAKCVIAGNVRRSARMSIMHWQDKDIMKFINCKVDTSQHWTTNISVELDEVFWQSITTGTNNALEVLEAISQGMHRNGEPGIFNSHIAGIGERGDVRCTNPCGEIALEEWENCNLGHLNLALLEEDELFEAARLMTRFLLRATLSPDVNPMQQAVLNRNRRIGVGFYGFQEYLINRWQHAYNKYPTPEIAAEISDLQEYVIMEAESYAEDLNIEPPIKHTTIAPTGTISTLSGHTPGIHPVHTRWFIRRVRYSSTDPILDEYPEAMKEIDMVSNNTIIVNHICKDVIFSNVKHPELVISAEELSIVDQLVMQSFIQTYWADNAVSYTVQLNPEDTVEDILHAIKTFGSHIKGSTMFPPTSIAQAPIEALTEEEYIELSQKHNSEISQLQLECFNEACPAR